ncbi:UNVERIFIED_CONTAM: hypothetical protein K2H54_012150 [Gekko kuhli]
MLLGPQLTTAAVHHQAPRATVEATAASMSAAVQLLPYSHHHAHALQLFPAGSLIANSDASEGLLKAASGSSTMSFLSCCDSVKTGQEAVKSVFGAWRRSPHQ